MTEIYNTLAKYFSGEANEQETALVQKYKQNNSTEFAQLKALWTERQKVRLSEFNTAAGWQKVQDVANASKNTHSRGWLKIAALASLLLVGIAGVYYLLHQPPTTMHMVEVIGKKPGDKVELMDGTIVYLNQGAKLSYPKTFDSGSRELNLGGEAFFEVKRDTKRPFIVHTSNSKVEVLGTSFNVDADEDKTEVAVATGKVSVENIVNQKSSILTPDQSATVTDNEVTVFRTVDSNYLAWKTGVFKFENTGLPQVIHELKEFYGDKIQLSDDKASCSFTSSFDNLTLDEIVEIIQLSCGLEMKEKNGSYELY